MTFPITNQWGSIKPKRLDVEHISIFNGQVGSAFNHQAQLAFDGTKLYATWSCAPKDEEEAGQQVMLSTSEDCGSTWSTPTVLAPSRPGVHAHSVVVSSGILVTKNHLIGFTGEWERYEAHRNKEREQLQAEKGIHPTFNVRTEARISTDRGVSWSSPTVVVKNQFGFMPPMRTHTGRLILPGHLTCSYTDDESGLTGWRRAMLPGLPTDYLDDWYNRANGARILNIPHHFNEANHFQKSDGTICMMLRNELHTSMGVSESKDNGETWSLPTLTDFSNSVSRSHFGRLPDGRWFCVNCPTPAAANALPSTRTPRTPVVLAISADGIHFNEHFIVGDDVQGEPRMPGYLKHGRYGYPFLCLVNDEVLVIYSTNKEDIRVAKFQLPR